jgi:hypothetical protein
MTKLGAHSRLDAVVIAARVGLIYLRPNLIRGAHPSWLTHLCRARRRIRVSALQHSCVLRQDHRKSRIDTGSHRG